MSDLGNHPSDGARPSQGGQGDGEGRRPHREIARGPWTHRVVFSTNEEGLPVAYRPHEVITTRGPEALGIANGGRGREGGEVQLAGSIGPFSRLIHVPDPIRLVEELRLAGIVAQLNHVYFSHSVQGSPVYGSPVYGSPVYGSPVYGSPVYGSPVYGSPEYAGTHTGPQRSSAIAPPDKTHVASLIHRIHQPKVIGSPHVIVLDTGLAEMTFRPPALEGGAVAPATSADTDEPDEDDDGNLDPAAGHGTFISGVIGQVAPGCEITHHRVLSTFGDGDEWNIVDCLEDLLPLAEPERTIINLSFGGYTLDHPEAMAWAVRLVRDGGAQVVASAGNDATWRPSYPAALPKVIGVGAVGPAGPAPFTNYGPWVSACAPGSALLSTFFKDFDDPSEDDDGEVEAGDFDGWAIWSGTSFAGPVVVGNLARLMMSEDISAHDAVRRLTDGPTLMRIPNLGTIVNFH